jgi:HEPN domain-containing protein
MTASDPGKDLQLFISSIPLHIERCVEDILEGNSASLGLAVWEMHLAVEKSLKLLIRQHGGNPGNIHDLVRLAELATRLSGVTIDLITLNKLPSGREAVQARYGEGRVRSLQELVGNYRIALLLISRVAKSLKREIAMNNASFLVRNPIEPD